MTPEEWQRIRPILESALELDASHRSSFLDGACADASMRREVESLIASHEGAGAKVLEASPVPDLLVEEELRFRLTSGKRVGPYEILDQAAEGGMGAVYRAVRADGQYQQRVALKIVRPEFAGEHTAARFLNERQILANLDHPNIAKILDGGTTAEGIPYFVMELIEGLPITDYCDRQKLTLDARLKIFRTVCSAVHYAHQHLVIHRDIKPTNILVTSDGVPKLLDFGIAKILDPSVVPENLTLTVAGSSMMTPEYASPEQLRGLPLTTATDVYSLGLVLYELLAGRRPYRFSSRMPHDIARAVLESDPEKPSTATLREEPAEPPTSPTVTPQLISDLRSDSLVKLRRRLSGDLDNIVLKALRKEPSARYSSADQLSDDIRRHLEGLPVLARKQSVPYRARKYVLRHKFGVAAAALVFLSLLTGFFLTLREARIARANQLQAERRFNDVRALAGSLIFEVHDSIRNLPGSTATRKLILQRAQEYLDRLAADSKSDPALLRELSAAYARLGAVLGNNREANIGNSEQSRRDYLHAIELREAVVAAVPSNNDYRRELAESYMFLAYEGDYLQKAFAVLDPMAAANPADQKVQYDLAKAFEHQGGRLANQGKWEEAKSSYVKTLELYQRLADANPKNPDYRIEVAFAHKHIGGLLIQENQLQPALAEYLAALPLDQAVIQADPQNVNNRYAITFTYSDIGFIYGRMGDVDRALGYYQKVFEIRSALVAADPQDSRARGGLANTYNYIAQLHEQKGDIPGAIEFNKKALALREALAANDPTNLDRQMDLALSQTAMGDKYSILAFQKNATRQQRLDDCRRAQEFFAKGLPQLQRNRQKILGSNVEFLANAEQAAAHCNAAIQNARKPGT